MTDELLIDLRCPLDPTRTTALTRDVQTLRCVQCATTFPIRHSLPILDPDAASLPADCHEVSQLRCQRKENRRINTTR